MINRLAVAQGEFELNRLPKRPRELLRAWDAADEYLLAADNAVVVPVHKNIVVHVTASDVIHGWFVQPRPFIRGPLAAARLTSRTDELARGLERTQVPMAGMLALAFDVDRGGGTRRVRVLSDTTRVPERSG